MRSEETQFCKWTPDDDGNWETGCKQMHIFFTGTPRDNKYAFCPYCGQSLKQVDEIMDSTNAALTGGEAVPVESTVMQRKD